jgi:hypothetical protein
MSLQGFQNFPHQLVLNCGTTINGALNAKNIYISGALTGAGISTDILNTDNTWTETNDFQDVVSYTGVDFPVFNDLTTQQDVDDAVAGYDPLPTNNEWGLLAPTFSNAVPPSVPTFVGSPINLTELYNYISMQNYTGANPSSALTSSNTWSGTQTFSTFVGVAPASPLENPTTATNPASKAYIDAKIEAAGKTLTFTISTAGNYTFANINRANVAKLDYWLFSGSCGGYSGSVVSGTIGNGNGVNGSLFLQVGTTADPAVVYTDTTALPSTTYMLVNNYKVGVALGACNLNGVVQGGTLGVADLGGVNGLSCSGILGANPLANGALLGTATSVGGAILVAYFV